MFRRNLNQNRIEKKSTQNIKDGLSCYLYLFKSKAKGLTKILKIKLILLSHKNNFANRFYSLVNHQIENLVNFSSKVFDYFKGFIVNKLVPVLRKYFSKFKIHILVPAKQNIMNKFGHTLDKYFNLARSKYSVISNKVKNYLSTKKNNILTAMAPVKKAYANGIGSATKEFFAILKKDITHNPKHWVGVAQVVLPITAIAILFGTIHYWNNLNYGLVLACDGEEIATIENESVFEQANQMVNQRLVYDSVVKSNETFEIVPTYKLAAVSTDKYSSPSTVCDKIIQQSKGSIEEASGLYIDNELFGVVKNTDELKDVLNTILDNSCDKDDAEVSFVENVENVVGLYPTSAIIDSEDLHKQLVDPIEDEVYYTVQDGDTPSDIADKFNMSLEDLDAINGTPISELIFPDEQIKVKNQKTLLNVSVSYIETYETPIEYQEIKTEDDRQYVGYSNVTQEGEEGILSHKDKVTYVNNIETAREEISTETTKEPVDKHVTVGTKAKPRVSNSGSSLTSSYRAPSGDGVSTGSLAWPLPGITTISSPFGTRWGSMHSGIDIANGNAYGHTIVAADGGTVVKACDSGDGYGICIIIRHNNGMSTLYAHCSSAYVISGQSVSKGQAIGAVGSTGNSFGAHLHFGVLVGGSYVDPLNYL